MFPEQLRWQSPRALLGIAIIVCLLLLPALTAWLDLGFYLSLATRIVIYAIAATGLNLALGYGGMVSLGHALFVGLGAYVVGISSYHGMDNGWMQLLITLVLTTVAACLVGIVSLRTRAISFIMITLAFGQMFYFLAVSLKEYGGDDGLPIYQPSILDPLPSLDEKMVLYYLALLVLFAFMYLVWRIVHSRFGYVLRGFQSNERRMMAAGYSRMRYQLSAFVVSALMCAMAGMLLANLTTFASPSYLSWQASGEFLLIVVIGGMGTVMGPLIGAFVLLALEETLSSMTQHWMAILGPLILLAALYASRGIWGGLLRTSPGASDMQGEVDQ
ncbi:branched-chain amino acid ABC transporter permease [Allopusillimonas soli]|uniref:Branched-chain amino acid ABC transporter permease n=1 Tax=Allopusillimonas soli TaxID=659016 RepID=A0A853FCV8_9BURK|nr:branched-chain amino acid ABC transporter permease [Allopusillimonas soli]NYT38664.1 branched-chain amino acid ABC transporter permease [Allopusillimonas soli]TEA71630.1 branched-chain amino acid ABC transporter permease [Allopusillimonas soli]